MGHRIHRKSGKKGLVYRIWSTISDGYMTGTLTFEELQDALFEDAAYSAISSVLIRLNVMRKNAETNPLQIEDVDKWYRQRTKFSPSEEPLPDQLSKMYSARLSTTVSTEADGTKIITVKIEPLTNK